MAAILSLRFHVALALAITLVSASGDEAEAATSSVRARIATPVVNAEIRAQADTLNKMLELGQLAEAERGARSLLAEAERKHGPRSLEAAVALDVLVAALLNMGRSAEPDTKAMADRAIAIKERLLGPRHPDLAFSLIHLANLHTNLGDYATATPLEQRALAIQEKVLGPDHPTVGKTLHNMSITLYYTGDYEGARKLSERALAIFEKAKGPEDPSVGQAINVLAALHSAVGEFDLEIPLQERALAIQEKARGPEHPDVAVVLINLAQAHMSNGDDARARPLAERAISIQEKALGPEHPVLAKSLKALGMIQRNQGDFTGARASLERALAIQEKALGPEHPDVAFCVSSLSDLMIDTGDFTRAKAGYERALTILEKALGPDHPEVANNLSGLAIALCSQERYTEARPLLERAQVIWEAAFGPESPQVGFNLITLAELNSVTGNFAAARPQFERALAIQEKELGPEHPEVARSLDVFARATLIAGFSADALALAERAVAIKTKVLGAQHPELALSLHLVAWADASLGKTAAAFDRALEAERISREHLRLTGHSLSEREALRYEHVLRPGLDLALTLAGRGLDGASRRRALDVLIRSRAVVLDEMGARHRVISTASDPRIDSLAAALAAARTDLAAIIVRGRGGQAPDEFRSLVESGRSATDKAERALAAVSAGFARNLERGKRGHLEVAASLPPGTALVAFAQYRAADLSAPGSSSGTVKETPSYLAFVQTAGAQDPEVVALGVADEIDSLVARWMWRASGHAMLGGFDADRAEALYRKAGEALRQRVWDPLGHALVGVDRVFVVPDGALNLVSIAALPAPEGGYLIEHGPLVHYVSAERDLVAGVEAKRGEGLLALGAVDYDATSMFASLRGSGAVAAVPAEAASSPTNAAVATSYRGPHAACADFTSLRFGSLPATDVEAGEIVRLWEKAARGRSSGRTGALHLRDAAASETQVKHSAPGRRVLHFATHGFFLDSNCGSAPGTARGIGSLSETPFEAARSVTEENPLLLSGLVLAGANHRALAGADEDDGILTAEEIASLDLSGVEWAVLSACETGVGDVRAGEGVFGLRRAFQVAGVGTVIMSLWSVDDTATRVWMKALHEGRLRKGLDTAEAVRQASLSVLARRRAEKQSTHPFFWAAFIAAGDWR